MYKVVPTACRYAIVIHILVGIVARSLALNVEPIRAIFVWFIIPVTGE